MANFDQHSYCAHREKNKGQEPCVENKDTTNCKFCLALTPEQQLTEISTPSYKLKKEKREARKAESATPPPKSLINLLTRPVFQLLGSLARKNLLNLHLPHLCLQKRK